MCERRQAAALAGERAAERGEMRRGRGEIDGGVEGRWSVQGPWGPLTAWLTDEGHAMKACVRCVTRPRDRSANGCTFASHRDG